LASTRRNTRKKIKGRFDELSKVRALKIYSRIGWIRSKRELGEKFGLKEITAQNQPAKLS
jgi:hypothetical protein